MFRRPLALIALVTAMLGGCAALQPNPDCRIGERCDAVLAAARTVTPLDNARVVIVWGRSPPRVFHAEVHVCYADGRNVLVDVMGDDLRAAVRASPWDDPPCR